MHAKKVVTSFIIFKTVIANLIKGYPILNLVDLTGYQIIRSREHRHITCDDDKSVPIYYPHIYIYLTINHGRIEDSPAVYKREL